LIYIYLFIFGYFWVFYGGWEGFVGVGGVGWVIFYCGVEGWVIIIFYFGVMVCF
jgi:hypothetical protein